MFHFKQQWGCLFMIHVIATITLAPAARDEFLGHFHVLVPLVHAEAGCLEYGPTVDVVTKISAQAAVRPDVVVVVEKWADITALEAHLVAPHMAKYREAVKALVASVDLRILEPA
jgi:quinol monooxygenase YgiN